MGISCTKNSGDAVLMRMQNNTTVNFTGAASSGEDFGSIDAGSTTNYHSFSKLVDAPYATIVIGSDTSFVGYLYIDYPSYLDAGKYTMQVYPDSLTYSGYNCTYIKD